MKKFFKIGCLGIIGIVILIAIIAAMSGGEETATTEPETAVPAEEAATEETPAEEAPAEEEAAPAAASLGEEIKVGDVYFTANEISTAQNIGGEYGVNAQSSFLVVNVTVRNEQNEALMVDSSFFKLKSGERTYDSDGEAGIYANEDSNFFLENINPGVAVTGNVVFDVPADLADPQLVVQTGFFGTETGTINLK